ncbi:MAG: hypothetical protein ACYC6L_02705 [Anaerolineae bacterium]
MRKVGWLLFWLAVALAQWFSAYVISVLLLLAFPAGIVSVGDLLRVLALTWAADVIAIFGLGWLALAIRRPGKPWRMNWRLLLVAAGSLVLLLVPLLLYRTPSALLSQSEQALISVPTPALAVLVAIIGFHLPGWFRLLAARRAPAEAL